LTVVAWNARRGLLAHRDAARVLAGTAPFGPRRLQHIESLLRILRRAGVTPRDAARAGHLCNNVLTGFVAGEARFAAFTSVPGSSRRKAFAEARRRFRSLPRRFRTLVARADVLTEDDPDGLFQSGIDILLDGIEALAARRTNLTRRRRSHP
jgi:hypothetical protein